MIERKTFLGRKIYIDAVDIIDIMKNLNKDLNSKLRSLGIYFTNFEQTTINLLEVTMGISGNNRIWDTDTMSFNNIKIENRLKKTDVIINLDLCYKYDANIIDNITDTYSQIKFYIDMSKVNKHKNLVDISDDIVLDKSEEELRKLGIFIIGDYGKMVKIDTNNRSLSFRTENNTYIINVSDDNGHITVIKIKNFNKKNMRYLHGEDVTIYFENKGE